MVKNTLYNFTEREMVIGFCKLLESKKLTFSVEVPFYNKSIDLVYYNEQGILCALEFKIHDWKKALKQASDHLIGAQSSYICIPSNKDSDELRRVIKDSKCGLILFDFDAKKVLVVEESKNELVWEGASELLQKGFQYSKENNNYSRLLAI
ncbi:MAG: hypothetical protein A2566_02635 [Candidatus Zambryskibacteria bacterium RIFOXYD1_FULL_40_13]|nr:MAG: hypothetical protein UT25_C0002G0156 [Parcubacteria group bacterium GW2011_GWC1_39_12]KKR19344.1 MAG: hypothetical protein UT49_C0002G0190 [Parcubacteria group bacterium GW2011_GWF1_39_37]KKR35273.1 MAG: hypothetical protein UT68_C0004G0081 [Parcubacteria group bacterium GW2011_GWC2_40_10]KKR52294.1 MAG: hypothetical protein UT89_C0002G0095 [Parcubacteria group bacterium GW2011_GWE1_40_20]KKR66264.1 MAG: hypothetical protein UU06_C0003G0014 [Parcubacteria group bacterium GW2011_GWB1_40_